jgi:ankyrin repeat protein
MNSLYYASFYGHAHIVEELGRKDVPYVASSNGTTPLHIAAQRGHLRVIETFINYKNIFTNKMHHIWD